MFNLGLIKLVFFTLIATSFTANAESLSCRDIFSKSNTSSTKYILLDVPLQNLLASSAYFEGHYQKAIELLIPVYLLKPDDAEVSYLIGNGFMKLHDYKNAIYFYTKAAKADRQNEKVLTTLHLAYMKNGEADKALIVANQLVAVNPEDLISVSMQAHALIELNRHEEAIPILESILEQKPNEIPVLGMKSSALIQLGRYNEAISILDSILELKPRDVPAMGMKAHVLIKLGRYSDAIPFLESLLAENYNDMRSLGMKAQVFIKLGRYSEAIYFLDSILKQNPDELHSLGMKAHALIKLKRFDEAVDTLDRKLRINPTDHIGRGMKIQVLIRLKQFASATLLIAELPEGIYKDFYMSQILIEKKSYKESIALLEKWPADQKILWELARANYSLGKMKEARQHIVRLIQMSEDVHLSMLAALIKINSHGEFKELDPLIHFLVNKLKLQDSEVRRLVQIKDELLWSYNPDPIEVDVSVYNSFWSGLYHFPVSGQTYHSTK